MSWRHDLLLELRKIQPSPPNTSSIIALSHGNTKTGVSGKFYSSIFVWNLPAVATCPGVSDWCLKHCYNADTRESKFPVKEWSNNWWVSINHPDVLLNNIVQQLSAAEKPCAVRLHSSGDFFSKQYIDLWINIASSASDVTFWTYTRSWINEGLLQRLEVLRSLRNVEIFASWDVTMDYDPPARWRRSYVYTDPSAALTHQGKDKKAFICPEQTGKVANCASCGFCMRRIDKDILFYFH